MPKTKSMRKLSKSKTSGHASPKKPYKLTYQVSSLAAQIAFKLTEPHRHITVDEMMHEFQLQRRRVQRHLAGLRVGVFNGVFYPAVLQFEDRQGSAIRIQEEDVTKIPETRIARAKLETPSGEDVVQAPTEDLIPVYLAFTVLRYLEGIVSKDDVSRLWRKLTEELAPDESITIAGMERKFFSVPQTPKDYRAHGDTVRMIVDALVRQYMLRIDYYGLTGHGQSHVFAPYTLAMYKGGLYVLGGSDQHEKIMTLAVERIDRVEKILDEAGQPVRFECPRDYSPEQYFQGVFGIIEGPETDVVLEIQNAETETRLKERRIHSSQKFSKSSVVGPDGYRKAIIRMRVRGMAELAPWVLSHSPYLKVLEPESLRREVEDLLSESLGLYRAPLAAT